MTGTPSKDRAEAHIDTARELMITAGAEYFNTYYDENEPGEMYENGLVVVLAPHVAEALDNAFAEGMKRAAEIARTFDDRSDIVKISGWGVSKAILSEAERR